MVHPYIRRRNGEERVEYPSEELRQVLGKTLGVPLFQEQAMRIAMVAAGFTAAEADGLRRAMATFRHTGKIHAFREKMIGGMLARGYTPDFAERCFRQIEGFGEYGFPESHAASFALLVYVSAWMKRRYPAAFACALLNSQPMGFYAPAQIVRDAREHGIAVLPPDVNFSDWDCTLEAGGDPGGPAGGFVLRLGLRQIKGLPQQDAEWIAAARGNGYADPAALWRRAGIAPAGLARLAAADAFGSMALDRRSALWAVKGLGPAPLPLFAASGVEERGEEPPVTLPDMAEGEAVTADYRTIRLTLRSHPMALLRPHLPRDIPAAALADTKAGARVAVSGLVLVRQRPGTARGVIFVTLEDETATANIIVWPAKFETFRRQVLTARLMRVGGRLQREGQVIHIVADSIEDMSALLDELDEMDEPGGAPLDPVNAQADEVRSGTADDPRGPLRHAVPKLRRHPRDQARTLFPSRDFH